MSEWAVLGFFILFFAPTLGRLHWIAGLATIAVGIIIMMIFGTDSLGALGIAGLTCIASGYTHHKITGEIIITDILSFVSGIGLIIAAIWVAA